MRRILMLLLLVAMLCPLSALADKTVTMTFVGDCTLGAEEYRKDYDDSLPAYVKKYGYDYFFANVRQLFEEDDLTILNFEGVLSDINTQEDKNKTYRFRGPTDYVNILTRNSVEVVTLANNHIRDFGSQGERNTKLTLDAAGVAWSMHQDLSVMEVKGVKIAFLNMYGTSTNYNALGNFFKTKMKSLKEDEGVNAIVFIFHMGREYAPTHQVGQENMAKFAINAGADLVMMHHPHVVEGITTINNRYVCYSLGNFAFGGNCKVRALETMLVQVDMTFSDGGEYMGQSLRIYPMNISDHPELNHYQPVMVKGSAAEKVMSLVQRDSSFKLNPFDEELGYAQQNYLPAK